MSFDYCELTDQEFQLISREFQRLQGKCYLDHAGATLYSEKQIDDANDLLKSTLFSNPHTSKVTEDLIDQVRYRILKHFNTDVNNYSIVFTSGATSALKLVAECFDFSPTTTKSSNGSFIYVQENHTSVLGMRSIVQTDNIFVLTREQLLRNLQRTAINNNNDCQNDGTISETIEGNSLITFSAQCNFSGFKYPLELIEAIQKNGLIEYGLRLRDSSGGEGKMLNSKTSCNFYVCLDAACFVSTNFLDLNKYRPDFVCISFYKMFGYPTGLGALIVSKRGQTVLKKRYFGGGTVKIAMSMLDFHEKHDCFHDRFEDGTISFLSIASLLSGFQTIERLFPFRQEKSSIERISNYVFKLAKYCYDSLKRLKYKNGQPLVKLYAHTDYISSQTQGGIVTFNLLHENGEYIGFAEVACLASVCNIILRTGCFCNPGACQVFLGLKNDDLMQHFQAGHICGDYNDLVDGVPTGAVRVSFGYMSKKEDVDRLLYMIKDCYLKGTNRRLEILENSQIPKQLHHVTDRLKDEQQGQQGQWIKLREICLYPIKSCGAFKIKDDAWELTDNGLKYDRCWMIVNANGVAVTQKTNTRLCLIRPIICLDKEVMILNFPDVDSISVPLKSTQNKKLLSSLCQSKVCGDLVEGIDCGDKVAYWLENCLGIPGIRLIQQTDEVERKNRDGVVKNINLSNQAQFLLINRTSVKWLASKIENWDDDDDITLDLEGFVDRFRANLVIETAVPFEENNYRDIIIGRSKFTFERSCTRCQMICIDQKTGIKTAEPLKTIAKEFKGKVRFGIYLCQKDRDINENSFISCKDQINLI